METSLRVKVAMSLMRALWGEITPAVRAVLARSRGEKAFLIEFYIDGDVPTQFAEAASCVEGEVMGDFSGEFDISHQVIQLNAPAKIPVGDGILVYFRKEPA